MFFYDENYIDSAITYHNQVFPEHAFEIPLDIDNSMQICCDFYCRWNKAIQNSGRVDLRIRIEEMDNYVGTMFELMNIRPNPDAIKEALRVISKKTNTAIVIIHEHGKTNPRVKDNGFYKRIRYDDVTPELQEYIRELGYYDEPEWGIKL